MNRKTSMLFGMMLLAANAEFASTSVTIDSLQAREAPEVVSTICPVIPRLVK